MKRKFAIFLLILFLSINFVCKKTLAAEKHNYKSAVLIEANTGRILYEYNKDEILPQASITKLMTYYVFMDLIKKEHIAKNSKVKIDISNFKLPSDGSSVPINNGDILTIDELIHTMLIASANNSACEVYNLYNKYNANILDAMNKKAKAINMKNTYYINTSGLTEDSSKEKYNHTTAYDTALLGASILKDYPETLKITSMREYLFKGNLIRNTNLLLNKDSKVDGMKTGHTNEAGYCLVATKDITSTNGNGRPFRLISVILGSPSEAARVEESRKLLSYGENNFENKKIIDKNKIFIYESKFYKRGQIEASTLGNIYDICKKGDKIVTTYKFNDKLTHNVKKGDKVGILTVKNQSNGEVKEFSLYANDNYKTVSLLRKIILLIEGLFK